MVYKIPPFYWLLAAAILVGILELGSLFGFLLPGYFRPAILLLIAAPVGYSILWEGFLVLLHLNFRSINALLLIAVAGAFYLGQYEEAAVVIVLYALAEKLEEIGTQKSKSSFDALLQKMPRTALLKDGNRQVSVDEVPVGELIIIKPGSMIPLDGIVSFGSSYVDESTITGEPIAKDKTAGDLVFAGTLNKLGYLEIKTTKKAANTTLAQIRELTYRATENKARTEKFIETFSRYYTPSIIILALSWMIIPAIFFQEPIADRLIGALSLLVIACPCALVISTPISMYSALGNASRQGALIKGGRYLEAIGRIKALALDKTRTLTEGKPKVSDIVTYEQYSGNQLLACIAGAEILSEHPLAESIVEEAKKADVEPHPMKKFESITGKGVKAECLVCSDKHRCIGKLAFILEEHHVPQKVLSDIDKLQTEGKTSVVIASRSGIEGIIALSDRIRPDSLPLIEEIKGLGITPVMLTGDQAIPSGVVAKRLGITNVLSDLLPEDKAKAINALINQYKSVGMVGDGINDAPALALSGVGISMSTLGSDTALEAASIVLLHDNLRIIPYLIRLGRRAVSTVRTNIAFAASVKLIFIILSLAGFANLALAIFADLGVTLIVILVSLRLLK